MLKRMKHLWRNTKFGVFQAVLVTIVVIGFSFIPPLIHGVDYLVMTVGGVTGLVLPYFFRDFLVDNDSIKVVLRYAGVAILASLYLFRQQIKSAPPIAQACFLAILALYISSYFWLLSDARIVVDTPERGGRP